MTDTIIHVSHNYRCSNETRTLGEAYPVVKIADEAMTQFRKCIELMRRCDHDGLRMCADELDEVIADALHDASWAYFVGEAREAYDDAKVRPVKVTRP